MARVLTVQGDQHGRVSVNAPDERVEKRCRTTGERSARLVRKFAD